MHNRRKDSLDIRPRASVSAGFVTGMMSGMATRRMDSHLLLKACGIDPLLLDQPRARIALQAYAGLYNATVALLEDEAFALFPAPLRPGSFEFLCRATMGSHQLSEALDRAARFLSLLLPDIEITIDRQRASAGIRIAEQRTVWPSREDPRRIFAYEWLLRLLHGLSCWLVARELSLDSVEFPYACPAHAADYALIYTAHSSFDARHLTAALNPNLLDLPIRRDESELRQFLIGAPGKIALLYRRDRETVHRVRDMVAEALPGSLDLDEAAARMHLSPRTLHRRLGEEGSGFRAIKDALRRDLALARLEKTSQSIARIAEDLGYAEPSAFFRAFQSWTGEAPTAYRQRITRAISDEMRNPS